MSYDLNYYEGFARIRERDIRQAAAWAEPADDYVPAENSFRSRVGSRLIGLGLHLLKDDPRPGLSRAA